MPAVVQVLGSVTNAARPVGNALVIALNLTNLEASQTFTSTRRHVLAAAASAPASTRSSPSSTASRRRSRRSSRPRASIASSCAWSREAVDASSNVSQEMWEIRGSLPPDILRADRRRHGAAAAVASARSAYDMPRFRGEMMSMTGVTPTQTAAPAFAQTALGVQSRIGDNWQLGFRGNLHRVEDPTDDRTLRHAGRRVERDVDGTALVADRRVPRRLDAAGGAIADDLPDDQQQADIRAHNFEWEHGDARVQVRYFAQQNLFVATPRLGSDRDRRQHDRDADPPQRPRRRRCA